MTAPINLDGLDIVTVADDTDLTLIRKGSTDYKIIAANLRKINVAGLPTMTTSPTPLDLLMVSQVGTLRQCYFGSIGFEIGTTLWFHSSRAPNGVSPVFWQIVPNVGDRLLAVASAAGKYTDAGGLGGTWLQEGVGGGEGGLTVAQIPAHTHVITQGKETAKTDTSAQTYPLLGKIEAKLGRFAGPARTNETGQGKTHNHGSDWRPLANVGVICTKVL